MWESQDTERRKDNRGKEDILKNPRHKRASALSGQEALHGPAVHAGGTQAGATAQRQGRPHLGNLLWWDNHRKGTRTSRKLSQKTLPAPEP